VLRIAYKPTIYEEIVPLGVVRNSPDRSVSVAAPFCSDQHQMTHLIMLLTEECNLRCDYCYIRKEPRTMTREVARHSVDFLFSESDGDVSIGFFGGEPLLEPDLIEFIHEYASQKALRDKRSIRFSMTTNMTLLSARNAAMIERLGIRVTLSLDGFESVHDQHRHTRSGRGSFQLVKRNLKRASGLTGVGVRLTVSPDTAGSLIESIRWLAENGFRSMAFSTVTEAQWSEDSLADLARAYQRLGALADQLGLSIINVSRLGRKLGKPGDEFGCGAARQMGAVDTEGFIYPCHRFIGYFRNGAAQRIGHVATGLDKQAREHYISANHSSTRSSCGLGLFPDGIESRDQRCGTCSLHGTCASRCMAISEYMTGDPQMPHPINRVLAQIEAAAVINQPQAPAGGSR